MTSQKKGRLLASILGAQEDDRAVSSSSSVTQKQDEVKVTEDEAQGQPKDGGAGPEVDDRKPPTGREQRHRKSSVDSALSASDGSDVRRGTKLRRQRNYGGYHSYGRSEDVLQEKYQELQQILSDQFEQNQERMTRDLLQATRSTVRHHMQHSGGRSGVMPGSRSGRGRRRHRSVESRDVWTTSTQTDRSPARRPRVTSDDRPPDPELLTGEVLDGADRKVTFADESESRLSTPSADTDRAGAIRVMEREIALRSQPTRGRARTAGGRARPGSAPARARNRLGPGVKLPSTGSHAGPQAGREPAKPAPPAAEPHGEPSRQSRAVTRRSRRKGRIQSHGHNEGQGARAERSRDDNDQRSPGNSRSPSAASNASRGDDKPADPEQSSPRSSGRSPARSRTDSSSASSSPSKSRSRERLSRSDHKLSSSGNSFIRRWLRQKNKEIRQTKREEKRKERKKIEEDTRKIQEKEERKEMSEDKVKSWMKRKRQEARSLRKQEVENARRAEQNMTSYTRDRKLLLYRESRRVALKDNVDGSEGLAARGLAYPVTVQPADDVTGCTCGWVQQQQMSPSERARAQNMAAVAQQQRREERAKIREELKVSKANLVYDAPTTIRARPSSAFPARSRSARGSLAVQRPSTARAGESSGVTSSRLSYDEWVKRKQAASVKEKQRQREEQARLQATSDPGMTQIVQAAARRRLATLNKRPRLASGALERISTETRKEVTTEPAEKSDAEEVDYKIQGRYQWGQARPKSSPSTRPRPVAPPRPASAEPRVTSGLYGPSPRHLVRGSSAYTKVRHSREQWEDFSQQVWDDLHRQEDDLHRQEYDLHRQEDERPEPQGADRDDVTAAEEREQILDKVKVKYDVREDETRDLPEEREVKKKFDAPEGDAKASQDNVIPAKNDVNDDVMDTEMTSSASDVIKQDVSDVVEPGNKEEVHVSKSVTFRDPLEDTAEEPDLCEYEDTEDEEEDLADPDFRYQDLPSGDTADVTGYTDSGFPNKGTCEEDEENDENRNPQNDDVTEPDVYFETTNENIMDRSSSPQKLTSQADNDTYFAEEEIEEDIPDETPPGDDDVRLQDNDVTQQDDDVTQQDNDVVQLHGDVIQQDDDVKVGDTDDNNNHDPGEGGTS